MNDEQHVLDAIDELVNEELTYTPDDYTKNNERYDKCELCQQLWHGLPKESGCPGAYATPTQIDTWNTEQALIGSAYLPITPNNGQGIACMYHTADGNIMRGTLIITAGENSVQSVSGVFIPEGYGEPGEYRYVPTEPDERPGFSGDLALYDEAYNLNPEVPQGFTDIGYIGDTP